MEIASPLFTFSFSIWPMENSKIERYISIISIIITVNIHKKMYNLGHGPVTESLLKRVDPTDILASKIES